VVPGELIYHLLSRAFRAIGEAGRTAGNRRLVVVADLFQAVPLGLARVARGEETVADVLARLREEARQQGLTTWLDGLIEQQCRWSTADSGGSEGLLYRVLHIALIDLRAEVHDTKNEEAWRVAHLFHTIPLRLARAADDGSYTEILARLRDDARRLGCAAWLERASEEAALPARAGVDSDASA
jgi:hypothetical protein